MADLSLLASTARAAEHEKLPGGLGRRVGHGRDDAVTVGGVAGLLVHVDVPRVARRRQVVAGRDGVQGGRGPGRPAGQLTLDVRQARGRQLAHVRLRVDETGRHCTQHAATNQPPTMSRKKNNVSSHRRLPLRERLGVDDIALVLQQNRLRWYGHVLRKDDDDWVKKCME